MNIQKKNKILIIRSTLLPLSETFIKEQAKALVNYKAVFFGKEKSEEINLDGFTCVFADNDTSEKSWFSKKMQRLRLLLNLPEPSLTHLIKEQEPSVIHIHFATEAVDYWPSVKSLNIPIVITLHGFDITTYKSYWHNQKSLFKKLYPCKLLLLSKNKNVYFVAVSEAIKQRAIEYGIPASKISVHYIGIDTDKFVIQGEPVVNREKRILFVGRLVEKKGVLYLLQAFNKVVTEVPDAKLVIAGDGPQLKEAKTYAEKNKLNAQFLGAITHQEVKLEMDKARILCLPSVCAKNGDREGLPTVIMEAQSCGLPVVTSAHGGATEGIIHGETGFAFAEKDTSALVTYLVALLQNDELVNSMSDAARHFARERFDIKECSNNLETFYKKISKAKDSGAN